MSPPPQTPWPGGVAIYRSPETSGFLLKALAPAPATIGVTLDPLCRPPQRAASTAPARVRVQLDQGALASVTELRPARRRQRCRHRERRRRVGGAAVPVGRRSSRRATYELSGLLRGQAGTEFAMRAPLAAGARFVLLDGAVTPVDLTPDEIGLAYTWRCGPASRDIGDRLLRRRPRTPSPAWA